MKPSEKIRKDAIRIVREDSENILNSFETVSAVLGAVLNYLDDTLEEEHETLSLSKEEVALLMYWAANLDECTHEPDVKQDKLFNKLKHFLEST